VHERASVEMKKYLKAEALRIGINIDCTIR
jgi:hypothetical protein